MNPDEGLRGLNLEHLENAFGVIWTGVTRVICLSCTFSTFSSLESRTRNLPPGVVTPTAGFLPPHKTTNKTGANPCETPHALTGL